MAWSEKLASGRYRGRYRDRQGNLRSLPHTYSQPAEAERAAAVREDSARRRPAAKKRAGRMTWGQWCDEWVAEHRQVEPGTQSRDDSRIARHIRPHWGDVPLQDIDRDAVVEWIDMLRTTPRHGKSADGEDAKLLAPRTVIKLANVFSASMRDAVIAGKIDVSPCQYLKMDRPAADDEYFLTATEFDRLAAAGDDLTGMVATFGVGTGVRWGELAGLHRRRVDTAQRRILVQEVFDKSRGEIKPYPKGRARRGVPITAELAGKLDAWMREHPPVPCRARHRDGKPCGDALLFPTAAGTPMHYQNFRRRHWDHAVAAAGLVGVTPHDLRHTYASWLIQSKRVTLDELGALLGHKDRSTTQRYAHFGEDHWDDVRDVLGDGAAHSEPAEPDEDTLRETIARLAAEKPGEWAAVAQALNSSSTSGTEGPDDEDSAPHLLHEDDSEEGGKIVHLDRFRRSAM